MSGRPEESVRPFDLAPREEQERLVAARLRALVEQARRAPFYATRLRGIAIESPRDLVEVPVLTREEMEENVPPQGEGLRTRRYEGGYVTRSGGSTGTPKFTIHDALDWESLVASGADVLRAAGLAHGDRVANCMLCGDLYGSFVSFDHINCRVGAMSFGFANRAEPETIAMIWRDFRFNVVEAIPAVLIPLLRSVKSAEPAFRIEKVLYGGELLREPDRDWLRAELGAKRVSSLIGANETGQLAYQCAEMTGAVHHAVDDFNYVEIVDDSGLPLPDGEAGRVVVTTLMKHAFPLLRYEIGDHARVVPGPCPCGRVGRRIEYLGRADDSLKIATLNFRYRDVEAALAGFRYSALQIAARRVDDKDAIVVRLESDAEARRGGEAVREALLSKMPSVRDRLATGALAALEVEVVPVGSLPRNPRSGKIQRVLDGTR